MKHAFLVLLPFLGGACQHPSWPAPARQEPPPFAWSEDATIDVQLTVIESPRRYATAADWEAEPGVSVLSAPRLTVFPHQAATLSVINQQAYVARFEVERTASAMLADPVVEVLEDGLLIEIVVHPTAEGLWGGWLRFNESSLDSLESAEMQLAGAPVTVQLPTTTAWAGARVLEARRDGHWLLDVGPRNDGMRRLIEVGMAPGPSSIRASDPEAALKAGAQPGR